VFAASGPPWFGTGPGDGATGGRTRGSVTSVVEQTDSAAPGDLGRAYLLLRAVFADAGSPEDGYDAYVEELTHLPGDRDELLRGFGTLIHMFMELLREGLASQSRPRDLRPQDLLHQVVPAVVARLANTHWIAARAVPTMAGALTAAALGANCYEWRMIYGPWHDDEVLPWAFTAWYLADLIDSDCGVRGHALDFVQSVMADAVLLLDRRS